MKSYRIRIQTIGAPAYSFTGVYAHSFDAISHALDLTQGQPARISAKVVS